MNQVIHKPILTEKAMQKNESKEYQFYVDPRSNKFEIKKAVEDMFEVEVKNVRTARIKGKVKVRFTKQGLMKGRHALRKKAYVQLTSDSDPIELVSGVEE